MCIRSHACPSVGWSVSLSRKCLKPLKTSDPGVNLYSCNLPTFIHFHPLSFTFIHFHSFSIFIHPWKHSSKMFIHQKRSSIHSWSAKHTYRPFFSVEKSNIVSTNEVEIPVSQQKDDEKGRVYANTCASRSKKEWMNELMNEWMNE